MREDTSVTSFPPIADFLFSMTREQIGKRLRFSIFSRDGFTCQYCGRTPENDDVVLHVDHVISVKDGGSNEKENLITSCRDCNLGKSAKSVLKRNKDAKDIEQELEDTKERLEQLRQLTKHRQQIQRTRQKISNIDIVAIQDAGDREYDDKTLRILAKARKEINNDTCFFEALEITQRKFPECGDTSPSTFGNYLRGVARNLMLPKEHSEILMLYSTELFQYDRMDRRTRSFILEYAALGMEFHQQVIRFIHKCWSTKHGQSFKLRDEVANVFNCDTYTVYKSGRNLQLLVCDAIVIILEEHE